MEEKVWGTGKSRGRENHNLDILHEKKSLFSINMRKSIKRNKNNSLLPNSYIHIPNYLKNN